MSNKDLITQNQEDTSLETMENINNIGRDVMRETIASLIGIDNIEDYVSIPDVVVDVGDLETNTDSITKDLRKYNPSTMMKVLAMTVQGFTMSKIMEETGLSHFDIRMMKDTDEFKSLKNMVTQEVVNAGRTFMMMGTIKAVKTLLDCLNSSNEKIKLSASTEILDRVGLKQPEQINIITKSSEISKMTDDELISIVGAGSAEIVNAMHAIKGGENGESGLGEESES